LSRSIEKRRSASVVRYSLIAGVIGILIIAAGVVSFFVDQASRQTPFEIQPPSGALYWGESNVLSNSRHVFYRVPDTVDNVVDYYQGKMNEHYGDTVERCIRIPPAGEAPPAANGQSIPFQFSCMFDHSGFRSTQYTLVMIYPGLPNDNPDLDAAGMTVVKYEQLWQS
jgi:hypothetical protein